MNAASSMFIRVAAAAAFLSAMPFDASVTGPEPKRMGSPYKKAKRMRFKKHIAQSQQKRAAQDRSFGKPPRPDKVYRLKGVRP